MTEPSSLTEAKKHKESVCKDCDKINENCSMMWKSMGTAKKKKKGHANLIVVKCTRRRV